MLDTPVDRGAHRCRRDQGRRGATRDQQPRHDSGGAMTQEVGTIAAQLTSESIAVLLRELVSHLRQNRARLREEWVQRIIEGQLLIAMTKEEIFAEATSVYDSYLDVL